MGRVSVYFILEVGGIGKRGVGVFDFDWVKSDTQVGDFDGIW